MKVKLLAYQHGYFWARIGDGRHEIIAFAGIPKPGAGRHRRKWWRR